MEGKLLGYIITKEGEHNYPEWVKVIQSLMFPSNKKLVQSFLEKVNFVIRFIHNFADIIWPVTRLLKKGVEFK